MVHFVKLLMAALEMLAVMWRQLQLRGGNQKSMKMANVWFMVYCQTVLFASIQWSPGV